MNNSKCEACIGGKYIREKNKLDENCTFKPEIDKKSEEIYQQKFLSQLKKRNFSKEEINQFHFNHLYNQANKRNQMIKKLEEQFYGKLNFTPTFNNNYIVETNFNERLEYFKNKDEEKKRQIEKEKDLKNAKDKGQRFFSPKLVAKQFPRENTNTNNEDIYEHMYSYARKYNQNKNYRISDQNLKIKNNSSAIHTTYDSENILYQRKKKIFTKIFSLMDSDQDNIISKFNIDLKKIPKKIMDIFKIIIKEIVDDDHTLNRDEFLLASEHLYELISFEERKIVLNFFKEFENENEINKKDKFKNEFTFKVIIILIYAYILF